MIFIGADHRGFELKERLLKRLQDEGFKITDLGNDHLDPNDDYIDFALKVAHGVAGNEENKGIILCGSGVGVDIVANKIDGIRSALVDDPIRARESREDDDANILSLPADELDEESAWKLVEIFIKTPFSEGVRHKRRLEKLERLEKSK